MLVVFVLLLLGCREELDYLDHKTENTYQLTKDNVKTQILQRKDYEARPLLKPSVDIVNAYLKSQYSAPVSSSSKVSPQDISGISLYTDVVEEVQYRNATYYSFYITGTETDGYERKLILKYTDNQLAGRYILNYKRFQDFRIDPASFQLEKLVGSSSSGDENSLVTTEISLSVGCTNYTITTFDCGYDHHSNGEWCTKLGIVMPYDVISSVYTANCQPGNSGGTVGTPGDGSGTGTPTGGGSVGGGTGTDQTPEIITIPTTAPLYIIQRPKGIICNTLNLDSEEIVQINSNDNVRLRLYQYLALWGINPQLCGGIMTQEAEEFIKAALAYFKDHPNATWQDYNNTYLTTPCQRLKKMLETPASLPTGAVSIKTALQDLQNTVEEQSTNHEEGYNFRYNTANGSMYAQKVTTWSSENNTVEYERTENTFGGAHFHQKSLQGMFSHADISVLYNFYFWFKTQPYNGINDANYPQPVHMLVANGQAYALAIEPADVNYFRQTYNDILNGDDPDMKEDFKDNMERDYSNLYSTVGGWNSNKTILEKTFLKFVTKIDNSPKHYNLKVSLYRANTDLTGWEKLTISQNGNDFSITPNPCN